MNYPSYEQHQYGSPQYGSPQPDYGQQYGRPFREQHGQQRDPTEYDLGPPPPTSGPPAPPDPQQPPTTGKTNGLAVVSLVFSILGIFPLGAVFGFMALSQIRNRGDSGRGFALAGLTLSGIEALACAGAVVFVLAAGGNPLQEQQRFAGLDRTTGAPSSQEPDGVPVEELEIEDCVNNLSAGTVSRLPRVPCSEPHDGEVVAIFDLSGSSFPGESKVQSDARDRCFKELDEYSPSTKEDDTIRMFYLHPTQASWERGDREVTCVAKFPAKHTGSIKG